MILHDNLILLILANLSSDIFILSMLSNILSNLIIFGLEYLIQGIACQII